MADRFCRSARFAVALVVVASCCPPPEADEPVSPPPPPLPLGQPTTTQARTIKPALLSRFERPDDRRGDEPKREMMKEPPLVPPARPKAEDPARRETLAPPVRPAPHDRLPDDVVIKLLETGRAAFVRCFKKAVQNDPTTISFKVRVHVELDTDGTITTANADTTDAALAGCLVRALGWLKFPASGKAVAVELPLFFRAD